jgi:putative SOS response-associated peptidase YedK
MRWGLIPSRWKKSAKEIPTTFNARAETLADKPMFRDAFKRNRCLIPASGYYEWQVALLLNSARRLSADVCGTVGRMEG